MEQQDQDDQQPLDFRDRAGKVPHFGGVGINVEGGRVSVAGCDPMHGPAVA